MHLHDKVVTENIEDHYYYFFISVFTIHLHMIKTLNNHQIDVSVSRTQAENSLIKSLILLWQMHVAIFSMNSLILKTRNQHYLEIVIDKEQSKRMVDLINQIKDCAEKYHYSQPINKTMYIKLLDHIRQYYQDNLNIITVENTNTVPWFSNSQFSVK